MRLNLDKLDKSASCLQVWDMVPSLHISQAQETSRRFAHNFSEAELHLEVSRATEMPCLYEFTQKTQQSNSLNGSPSSGINSCDDTWHSSGTFTPGIPSWSPAFTTGAPAPPMVSSCCTNQLRKPGLSVALLPGAVAQPQLTACNAVQIPVHFNRS